MKILNVISYFYPALTYGGPAKVAYDLTKELSKKNEVVVYTTDVWDEKRRIQENEKIIEEKNLKIIYFRNFINSIAYKYRIFTGFGMVFQYIIDKNKFYIVHIHDVFIIPQILIGYLALLFKKPYIISPHGVLDPVRVENRSLPKKVIYFIAKPVLKRSKMLVATSDKEKKILGYLGYDTVTTVYNGVDRKMNVPSRKYKELIKSDTVTFFYVGKIHKLKGLLEFIEAVSKVKYKYQVIIAGPDDGGKRELADSVKELRLRDKVHFIDFVDESNKSELFAFTDLFIYPSYSEGFSISILEALKYSVPVLITDECNFHDVKIYQAGYVIGMDDLKGNIYRAIKELDSKDGELRLMGKKGRKLIENRYSIEVMARSIQKLYEI